MGTMVIKKLFYQKIAIIFFREGKLANNQTEN